MQGNLQNYSAMHKAIHWVTALILLALLSIGYFMVSMEFSPLKLNIYMIHKSFGMTIFLLVLIRVIWRFVNPPPKPLETHAPWEKILSKFIHLLLYAGMIGMPLSGWLMSSAAEFPNSYFGLFDVPALSGKDEDLFRLTRSLHELTALMLIGAVGLHFLGAAKHHIIDKDVTLRRMGGNYAFLAVGGLLLAGASFFALSEIAEELFNKEKAPQAQSEITGESDASPQSVSITDNAMLWNIDYPNSAINIEFSQYGAPVSARFQKFDGRIVFDPENLAQSSALINIDVASLKTGSDDRDMQAQGADWFAVNEYPTAVFTSEAFTHQGGNNYSVRGTLKLRDVSLPLIMPFTLDIIEGDSGESYAEMRADISLMRLDFGVGQGQWSSTEAIDDEVKVSIILKAQRL